MRAISVEELCGSGRQYLDCYEDIETLFLSEARCFFPSLPVRHTKSTSSTCLHPRYAGAKEGESRLGHLLEGVIRAINHHPLLLGLLVPLMLPKLHAYSTHHITLEDHTEKQHTQRYGTDGRRCSKRL